MNKKTNKDIIESQASASFNKVKWLTICLVIAATVFANIYFSAFPVALRAAGFIVISVLLLLLAKTTTHGAIAWSFIKASKAEMRKVVWPTRKETVNTTMIIIVVVLVSALILWVFDSIFMYLVRSILSI